MNNNGNKRAPTTATQRLKQDYLRIKKDPVPYICAEPLPSNILEWYGPPDITATLLSLGLYFRFTSFSSIQQTLAISQIH